MTSTLALTPSARDLLPTLASAEPRPVSGMWDISIGLIAGLALTLFAGFWVLGSGPAAAEGDGCRMDASMTCAALTALTATGLVAETK